MYFFWTLLCHFKRFPWVLYIVICQYHYPVALQDSVFSSPKLPFISVFINLIPSQILARAFYYDDYCFDAILLSLPQLLPFPILHPVGSSLHSHNSSSKMVPFHVSQKHFEQIFLNPVILTLSL